MITVSKVFQLLKGDTADSCNTTMVCGSLERSLEKENDTFHKSSGHEELPKLNYCVKFARPFTCQRPVFRLVCPGIESCGKRVDGERGSHSDNSSVSC